MSYTVKVSQIVTSNIEVDDLQGAITQYFRLADNPKVVDVKIIAHEERELTADEIAVASKDRPRVRRSPEKGTESTESQRPGEDQPETKTEKENGDRD